MLSENQINQYIDKGMQYIWIHQSQKENYSEYSQVSEKEVKEKKRSKEGALLSGILRAEKLSEEKKKVLISETAKEVMSNMNLAKDHDMQEKIDHEIKKVVHDVIDEISDETEKKVSDIFKISKDLCRNASSIRCKHNWKNHHHAEASTIIAIAAQHTTDCTMAPRTPNSNPTGREPGAPPASQSSSSRHAV